jgi:thiol-disulfide isomerase/thioredoxin
MSTKTIVSAFSDRHAFMSLLEKNPGVIILKMGATWCGPCKKIKTLVDAFFSTTPDNVVCCDIDVDESFDLYAYFKAKKMVNGVPTIMAWKKGNTSFIPDTSVSGIGANDLNRFFEQCVVLAA